MERIEGHQDLIRDPATRAIINNSKSDFNSFMQQRNEKLSTINRIEALEQKILELEQSLAPRLLSIEQLLTDILKRDK